MVITATNQDIFTFLNRQCYLAVATDFRVVTAMRKRRRIVLLLFMTSGRADNVCEHGHRGNLSHPEVRLDRLQRGIGGEPVGVEIIVHQIVENAKIRRYTLRTQSYAPLYRMKHHFIYRGADAFLAILLTDSALPAKKNVSLM